MSADLTGLSSIDRPAGLPVSGSAGASVSPGRVVVRSTRPDPDPTGAPPSTSTERPLQGSGLDPRQVVGTTDRVASRHATGGVALEVGLEQARQAMLRSRPNESLGALDGIWDGAQQTEEGWYLRSGALHALGLPGESDRVAGAGLLVRPSSSALAFLQSLARMAIGDFAGARASLQSAIARAPFEPALLVQHALLQAKAGDPRSAEMALLQLGASAPDHPALIWGRGALSAVMADDTRRRSRGWEVDVGDLFREEAALQVFPDPSPEPRHAANAERMASEGGTVAPPLAEPTDLASSALERLGARLAQPAVSMAETAQHARGLIRALSAGGSLVNAMTGEQAHAARVVLMVIAAHAEGEATDASPPVSRLIEQLLPMLAQRRVEEARLLVQRQRTIAREPVSRWLLAIIRGATTTAVGDGTAAHPAQGAGEGVVQGVVQGDADRAPLTAIRLGLGLLEESAVTRAADSSLRLAPAASEGSSDRVVLSASAECDASRATHDPEHVGAGWGAARQAAAQRVTHGDAPATSMRVVALLGVILAVVALAAGHGLVAIVLAVGATWLSLRDPRITHHQEAERPQDDPAPRAAGDGSVSTHTREP